MQAGRNQSAKDDRVRWNQSTVHGPQSTVVIEAHNKDVDRSVFPCVNRILRSRIPPHNLRSGWRLRREEFRQLRRRCVKALVIPTESGKVCWTCAERRIPLSLTRHSERGKCEGLARSEESSERKIACEELVWSKDHWILRSRTPRASHHSGWRVWARAWITMDYRPSTMDFFNHVWVKVWVQPGISIFVIWIGEIISFQIRTYCWASQPLKEQGSLWNWFWIYYQLVGAKRWYLTVILT